MIRKTKTHLESKFFKVIKPVVGENGNVAVNDIVVSVECRPGAAATVSLRVEGQ
jgi:hypothetical protein